MIVKNHSFKLNGLIISYTNYESTIAQFVKLENDAEWAHCIASFIREWYSAEAYVTIQTSGSTSAPKVIHLSKNMMVKSAIATCSFFDLRHNDAILLALPVTHIAGKMMIVRALITGLDVTAIEPSRDFTNLKGGQYQFSALTPFQVAKLINQREFLTSIRSILIGGGVLPIKLEEELVNAHKRVFVSYGMTETASHVALRRLGNDENEYKAINNIEFSVNKDRCLVIHWSDADIPLLETKDIVELTSPTSFIWRGRKDNVVNSGGLKFYPEELEKRLDTFLDRRYYLKGEPHPELGEQLVLTIEGDPMQEVELGRLKVKMQRILSQFEMPKKIYFKGCFKETDTGKVIRE